MPTAQLHAPMGWPRSLLFTPGDQADKLAKVARYGADANVFDLEDAVAPGRKDLALGLVQDALSAYDKNHSIMVRVNGPESGRLEQELDFVASTWAQYAIIPKVERSETAREIDALLSKLERRHNRTSSPVKLVLSIESALGLVHCNDIARAAPARTLTLLLGSVDFRLDVNLEADDAETELIFARSAVAVAARVAALENPIDGPFLALDDLDGLRASAARARQLGFGGKVALHPRQVLPIQEVFAGVGVVDEEQSRRIVTAFEQAEREGNGALQVDGIFVDYPVYARAKRQLDGKSANPSRAI